MLHKYQEFRKTRKGSAIVGTVSVVFVAIFGSWAIDSGSLWHYALAFFFLFDAILSFANVISPPKVKPDAKKRRAKKTT